MLEINIPIIESFNKSALSEMTNWLLNLPNDAPWYVISDYCIGDQTKNNDAISFSILLNHDNLSNIKEYINRFAPCDLKSTRSVSYGFLQYINSPVIFHITFIIDRNAKLLKDYSTTENMRSFLPAFKDFVNLIDSKSTFEMGYIDSIFKRIESFEKDFNSKNFNAKLSRQIYYVASFASLVFYYLTKLKSPSHIAWVSDRDALIDKHDGIIYDLAYFMFLYEYGKICTENTLLDKPKFIFQIPEKSGKNNYDELVRIPDHLAGTLADFDIDSNSFSKEKFYDVLYNSITNSNNHAIFQVYGNSEKLSCRRIVHRA